MFIERGVAAKPIPSGRGLAKPETTHCPFCFGFPLGNRLAFLQSRHRHTGRAASLIFRECGACCIVWLPRQSFQHVLRQASKAKREIFRSAFGRVGGGLQAGSQVSSPGRQLRMAGRRYFCDERAESCSVAGQSLQWEGQADGLCEFSLLLVRQSRFSLVSVGLEPKFSKVWNPSTPPDDRCARILSSRLSSHNSLAFSKDPEIYLLGQAGLPRSFPPMPGFYQQATALGKPFNILGRTTFRLLCFAWLDRKPS